MAGLEVYFGYLDDLRASGATNMYGAGPYLQEEFELDRQEARDVLLAWMRTFGDGSLAPQARAAAAKDRERILANRRNMTALATENAHLRTLTAELLAALHRIAAGEGYYGVKIARAVIAKVEAS